MSALKLSHLTGKFLDHIELKSFQWNAEVLSESHKRISGFRVGMHNIPNAGKRRWIKQETGNTSDRDVT